MLKSEHGYLVHETLNVQYLKNQFMNWVDFWYADC